MTSLYICIQINGTDKRLLLTYFTKVYSEAGSYIQILLVNCISINIVLITLKVHLTVLIINQENSIIKCMCLKIAMELFTYSIFYGSCLNGY